MPTRGILLSLLVVAILMVAGVVITYITNRILVPTIMTPYSVLDQILKKMGAKTGHRICDLGAGDYRLLMLACARYGSTCEGFEISPILNLWARLRRLYKPFTYKYLRINNQDMFTAKLQNYDLIYCHLNSDALRALRYKFESDLQPGSKVYSYEYRIPEINEIEATELSNGKTLYMYDHTSFRREE